MAKIDTWNVFDELILKKNPTVLELNFWRLIKYEIIMN